MTTNNKLTVRKPKAPAKIQVENLASFIFLTRSESRKPAVLIAQRAKAILNKISSRLIKLNFDLLAGNFLHNLLHFLYVLIFNGIQYARRKH